MSTNKNLMLMEAAIQASHDIRSPLAVLNTLLGNLENIPHQQKQLLDHATQRINDIANNLLDVYRREKVGGESEVLSNQTTQYHFVNTISGVLTKIIQEKQVLAENKSINFTINLGKEANHIMINVNLIPFQRVMSNLLNNAIEAITSTGEISVKLIKQESFIVISITDTGNGMSPEVLNKIKFGSVSYGKEGGSGVGLASAIKLAKQYDGKFDIISRTGLGTTTTLALPIRKNKTASDKPSAYTPQ